MSRRKLLLLSFAVFLCFGAVLMLRGNTKTAAAPTLEIMVAAADIPAGQFIQAQNTRWQPWGKDHLTEAMIVRGAKNAAGQVPDYNGAVTRQGIRAGEPVMKGEVVKPEERGFLAAVLNPGMRAVAAPITNVTGIAGFVFPGDRVDLILTHTMTAHDESQVGTRRASVTIVRNARVLALDQSTNDQANNQAKLAKTVTLEVDPKQAEVVTLALQLGTLSLSLRAIAENDPNNKLAQPIGYDANAYTLDSDISQLIPAPKERMVTASTMVRVLRGKESESENFGSKTSDGNGGDSGDLGDHPALSSASK